MAITTVSGDAGTSSKTNRFGSLSWLVVILAVVATVAFALVVLDGDGDGDPARVTPERTDGALFNPYASDAIERWTITQHRREVASASVSERGSINAIEHRALAEATTARRTVTDTAIEHGSADAAEHRGVGG